MWILKIGGSWIKNPKLNELINLLSRQTRFENIVVVVGGGCFSDSVRLVYSDSRMSDKTGNFIALKATEMFAHLLNQINKDISLIYKISSLKEKKNQIKVWMPSLVLKEEPTFIKTWESTSDSVAAWLHAKLKAKGLLFIKSLILEKEKYKLNYLQKKNILDKNVDKYLFGQKNIKIIGPDVVDLLKKSQNWSNFFLQLKEVEL